MVAEPQPVERARKRASRHKRLEKPRSMRLTERDRQAIKAVNDYRIMRQDQVQRLLFPSKNTAQVRLWLLWQHGFLRREFLPVLGGIQNSPILYRIDRRGAELLQREFGYDKDSLRWSRSKQRAYRFLEHTLGLSEIRLAIELSCQRHDFSLDTWLDEKTIKANYDVVQVRRRRVAVVPDGYFTIAIPSGKLHFFLEYDRGPERLTFFRKKISAYWAYFQSGKCKDRYGTNRIRVLTITEGGPTRTGRRRLANVHRLTKELGGHTWFWFASMNQIIRKDFLSGPIWQQTHTEEPGMLI